MKVDGQEKNGRGWHEMCSEGQAPSGSPLHNKIRNQNLLSKISEKPMRILTDLTDISTVFSGCSVVNGVLWGKNKSRGCLEISTVA